MESLLINHKSEPYLLTLSPWSLEFQCVNWRSISGPQQQNRNTAHSSNLCYLWWTPAQSLRTVNGEDVCLLWKAGSFTQETLGAFLWELLFCLLPVSSTILDCNFFQAVYVVPSPALACHLLPWSVWTVPREWVQRGFGFWISHLTLKPCCASSVQWSKSSNLQEAAWAHSLLSSLSFTGTCCFPSQDRERLLPANMAKVEPLHLLV